MPLNRDLFVLLADDDTLYASVQKKQEPLTRYTDACIHEVSGQKTEVSITELVRSLQKKAAFLTGHIRATEWVTDEEGNGWFNGYYDNHGRCVEGVFAQGVRMMLTSQVFAVMAQTATDEQVAEIVRSADKYLYCDAMGGYRLNTDFGEVKMDLGRMFGFAYGEKENGAVFSHMAVMFANALYKRGFVKEGHRALDALYRQSVHFETSRIYPGIPEYFNSRGKGMYHYLTGAASWYMLTVITEMFGAKGCAGNLMLEPKLERQQFDLDERAELFFSFAGQSLHLVYENKEHKEYGEMTGKNETFVMNDYGKKSTFASFLPGIAGIRGIPIWCYYVNRGQCVVSFGVDNKDHAIMEFYPAHQAYQNVKTTGFRTFLKKNGTVFEPFSDENITQRMQIHMNGLAIEAEPVKWNGHKSGVLYTARRKCRRACARGECHQSVRGAHRAGTA